MFLATPELPSWKIVVAATVGIWLLAGAAFAINCLVEREIDSRMARTARRPMALGEITVRQTLIFSGIIGGAGMWLGRCSERITYASVDTGLDHLHLDPAAFLGAGFVPS